MPPHMMIGIGGLFIMTAVLLRRLRLRADVTDDPLADVDRELAARASTAESLLRAHVVKLHEAARDIEGRLDTRAAQVTELLARSEAEAHATRDPNLDPVTESLLGCGFDPEQIAAMQRDQGRHDDDRDERNAA